MAGITKPTNQFEELTRLKKWSPYYLSLPIESHEEDSDEPHLILLCTWTDAHPKHIAKFISGHRALFPSSPILLARTFTSNFFHMPTSTADPAIKFVISHLAGFKTPKILTHCLSNGGIGHLTVLARAYHHHTQGTSLPLSTIIYDSAPTRGDFRSLFSALSQGFPRNPLLRFLPSVLLSLLITLFFILPRALGFTNTADRVCNDLLGKSTEGQRFIPDEATRTFVYSDTDRMTPMAEVLVEAKLAEGRGMKVRREMWVGSGHVGHMRADPERYWRVVGESWRWSASE